MEIILERWGERELPWERDRRVKRQTHCLRTGDLEEESVLWMQFRKCKKESGEVKFLAMDSSSVAATERVSRSESLLRQVMTRCLRSLVTAAGFRGGDILELFFNFLALPLAVADEFGGWTSGGEMVRATFAS